MNIQQEAEFWRRRLSEYVDSEVQTLMDGASYISSIERDLDRGEYDRELEEY